MRNLSNATRIAIAVIALLLPVTLAGREGAGGEGRFAETWLMVRLTTPLTEKRANGSSSTITGRQALDVRLRAADAQRTASHNRDRESSGCLP